MGELMNKMVDMVVDLEDGILNSEKDCIYAWKYAVTIMAMYEDKINNKRQSTLVSFDNGLKNLILSSKEFADHYPGRYTSRTNFFDTKIKDQLILDIIEIFRHAAVPKLHELAIEKSKIIAEKHDNPTLNRIIQWAIDNYKCTVDSYFDVKVEDETQLYYSLNTVILHLKNGYDMSIVGFVGTDHDDKFAISIFNTNTANMESFDDKLERGDIQSTLDKVSEMENVSPMHKILKIERKRKEELNAQLDYLRTIHPMIKKELLDLPVAEKVVGSDYLWACERNRNAYGELPEGFTFEDLQIPEVTATRHDVEDEIVAGLVDLDENNNTASVVEPVLNIETTEGTTIEEDVPQKDVTENKEELNNVEEKVEPMVAEEPVIETPVEPEQSLFEEDDVASMFDENHKPEVLSPSKPATDKAPATPVLNVVNEPVKAPAQPTKNAVFNDSAILLPGAMIDLDGDGEPDVPSYTGFAVQAKTEELPDTQLTWIQPEHTEEEDTVKPADTEMQTKIQEAAALADDTEKKEEIVTPDLMFDDIDSLFQ